MRNLKRALSLALASVMLLGMMVVGAGAASYPDVDEKDNVEAIEVLNAVNVMIGRQGNFEPDEAVNRHEMAVIMAKLVLGVDTADNYVGSHPFTDVVSWADKYVAACYENGLIAGTSATTYGGGAPLTAVQAAAMMLRALGYKDLNKGYQGDWRAPITAKANEIRLFNGVASNPNEQLNRNQVAQLALNTLKSPMVTMTDGTFNVTSGEGNVVISGGSRKYEVIARKDAYAKAISDVETEGTGAEGIKGYTVELGEHLYNGKLKLTDAIDDFGRPSRKWEFDGKLIGLYAKTELLEKEYVGKVTGKDLYDLLGSSIISGKDQYDLTVTIDGVEQKADVFRTYMAKNNKASVPYTYDTDKAATGDGVLTEVYTDSADNGQIYIAIINTYLAQASRDYDAKQENLTVTIYGVKTDNNNYVKNAGEKGSKKENVKLDAEDFPMVKDMKKDDFMLVNVAGDEVVTVSTVEVLEGVTVSSFKTGSNVTVDGTKYNFASAAYYDNAALSVYTGNSGTVNLKDTTYNIYLDTYGNLLGIKEVEAKKNYVFIAGIDSNGSNIANGNGKARALFLDGTSAVIEYNTEKSTKFTVGPLVNTWCTYVKNSSNIYTLTQVADTTGNSNNIPQPGVDGAANQTKLAQHHETVLDSASYNGKAIDKQNISLAGRGDNTGTYQFVHGNKDTVYLTAKLNVLTAGAGIINGVDSVVVGAENANLLVWEETDAGKEYDPAFASKADKYARGIYTLYNNNGIVIAAVVVGEDSGAAKNLVYTHTSKLEQEAYGQGSTRTGEDEWTWTRKVIQGGEEVLLTEKSDKSSYLEKMVQYNWYEVRLNANGEVVDVNYITDSTGAHAEKNDLDPASLGSKIKTIDGAKYNHSAGQWGYNDIGGMVALSGVDTVLYSERFESGYPRYEGRTLYVNHEAKSGFLVHEDAKIVLQQYDRNTQETYITEYTGADSLKGIVAEIKDRNTNTGKNFDYQVNAVIEKGIATSLVFSSKISDFEAGYVSSKDTGSIKFDGSKWIMTITTSDASKVGTTPSIDEMYAAFTSAKCTNVSMVGGKWNFTTQNGMPYTGETVVFTYKYEPDKVEKAIDLSAVKIGPKGTTVVYELKGSGSLEQKSVKLERIAADAKVATVTIKLDAAGKITDVTVTSEIKPNMIITKLTINAGSGKSAVIDLEKDYSGDFSEKQAVSATPAELEDVAVKETNRVAVAATDKNGKVTITYSTEAMKDGKVVNVVGEDGKTVVATIQKDAKTGEVTVTPKSDKTVADGTTVEGLDAEGEVAESGTVTVDAETGKGTGTVTEKNKYSVTVSGDEIVGGTVTPSANQAVAGATVTLTIAAEDGYALKTITVTGVESGETVDVTVAGDKASATFTMPGEAVVVNAVFEDTNDTRVAAASIAEADKTQTVKANKTVDVAITLADEGATVVAASGDTAVATADYTNGKVTIAGVAEGTADVTVTVTAADTNNYKNVELTISVTVEAADPSKVPEINKTLPATKATGTITVPYYGATAPTDDEVKAIVNASTDASLAGVELTTVIGTAAKDTAGNTYTIAPVRYIKVLDGSNENALLGYVKYDTAGETLALEGNTTKYGVFGEGEVQIQNPSNESDVEALVVGQKTTDVTVYKVVKIKKGTGVTNANQIKIIGADSNGLTTKTALTGDGYYVKPDARLEITADSSEDGQVHRIYANETAVGEELVASGTNAQVIVVNLSTLTPDANGVFTFSQKRGVKLTIDGVEIKDANGNAVVLALAAGQKIPTSVYNGKKFVQVTTTTASADSAIEVSAAVSNDGSSVVGSVPLNGLTATEGYIKLVSAVNLVLDSSVKTGATLTFTSELAGFTAAKTFTVATDTYIVKDAVITLSSAEQASGDKDGHGITVYLDTAAEMEETTGTAIAYQDGGDANASVLEDYAIPSTVTAKITFKLEELPAPEGT